MKHTFIITAILLGSFLLAQFVGLAILHQYIDSEKSVEEGKTIFKDLPIGERPPLEEKTSFIPTMIAIIIGTLILLVLIRYHLIWVWKAWFLIAVVLSLTIAVGAFLPAIVAFAVAAVLGLWKIFRPNVWVQNFTELFIYGGLAAIFVPLFSLFSIAILLLLISGYDAYAVWKSKHMITLAKSQTEAKVFAGLFIPYHLPQKRKEGIRTIPVKVRTAILGGGDIGFPLLFAGVILKEFGVWLSLIIPFFAALGLAFLLWKGDERKFYPAMPFISAGCFLGWGVVWAVSLL
ncbi:hypothetical protein HYX14_06185 [Candidatus Woesearchaeota archaeon]|nr:hypothetical protein [Candidatus Woesearchaeota archaeon]